VGTITKRTGRDGSISYTAEVRIKAKGKTVFSEVRAFPKRTAARNWIERMEDAFEASADPAVFALRNATVASVINCYLDEPTRRIGKTKEECLRAIVEMAFVNSRRATRDRPRSSS
jgi:hypothetical protein